MAAMDISILADDVSLLSAEHQILGFSHPELGAMLCEHWRLPAVVVETARFHHNPAGADQHREVVALVAWANAVETLGTDANMASDLSPSMGVCLDQVQAILADLPMGLPENDDFLKEAQAAADDMIALF